MIHAIELEIIFCNSYSSHAESPVNNPKPRLEILSDLQMFQR